MEQPFKECVEILRQHYEDLQTRLKIEKTLNATKLFFNDEEIKKLEKQISAYECLFPFFVQRSPHA